MTDNLNPDLTAGELSHLWEHFMNCSASSVVLDYFQKKIESEDIRSVCGFALLTVESDKNEVKNIFKQENYPLSQGFSEKDMNPQASKPFTDEFILYYLHNMAKVDLSASAMALSDAVRVDIRKFFRDHMEKAMELHDKAASLLLEKGLFVRSPRITTTHKASPKAQEGFMSNFFGSQPRALTACEANELHKNIINNYSGKCLLMAFSQSNKNPTLKRLLQRGKELASKIMTEFSEVLIENDLPVAMTWDTHVLDATDSPFSDKLIAFLLDQLNRYGIANYGYGAAFSNRKDLKAMYARIIADVYQYEEDVKTFMIENQWLEQPPMALDRRTLAEA